jgi:polar amino acid transport system substrate-binding protein
MPTELRIKTSPAFANSLQEIKAKGQIRAAMYKNVPPFSVNVEGIDVDIATALAEKLSVKLDLMWFEADENVDDDLRNVVWKGHYLGGGTAG